MPSTSVPVTVKIVKPITPVKKPVYPGPKCR